MLYPTSEMNLATTIKYLKNLIKNNAQCVMGCLLGHVTITKLIVKYSIDEKTSNKNANSILQSSLYLLS